ncbi:MAG TPA: hypothetical protein VFF73_12250 [Planctomycetota bacterium]|nr:hypothetical protein [Planctomycetota bacterium]
MRSATLLVAILLAAGCGSSETKDNRLQNPPPEADPRDQLQGTLDNVPWPKDGKGLSPGVYLEETRTKTGAAVSSGSSVTRVTVVADAGESMKVEVFLGNRSLGYVLGLSVKKADGTILDACAAKKGEKAKPIKVAPPVEKAVPTVSDESVDTPVGTYACTKSVVSSMIGDHTIWVGKDADARGILIKESDDNAGTRTLKKLEIVKDNCVHALYDDGSEGLYKRDPSIPFYGVSGTALIGEVREGTTVERAWGSGAQPSIDWGK